MILVSGWFRRDGITATVITLYLHGYKHYFLMVILFWNMEADFVAGVSLTSMGLLVYGEERLLNRRVAGIRIR